MSKILSNKSNLQILHEDNHIVVINKRAGDIVQGDKTGDIPLNEIVKLYIKDRYNKPGNVYLGTVHRLDRPTTGIVIFAKTSKALTRLNKMLVDKHITKTTHVLITAPGPGNTVRTGIKVGISTKILQEFCYIRRIHIAITVKVTVAGRTHVTGITVRVSSEINQE